MVRIRLCLLLFGFLFLNSCAQPKQKINGVSFVASRDAATQENVDPVLKVNANYAAVMPFGFIRTLDNPDIVYDTERQWYGETRAGAKQYIELLKSNNIQVMLKPQIWIWRGEFTGYLKMTSEEDWKKLEDSYRDFILNYAELAQETQCEMLCIGTELEQFIVHRPDYWSTLISEIKEIYQGELTYAANWDEYKRVPFWSQLDYVGVDAYFPVSENKTPTLEDTRKGWQRWKDEIKGVSDTAGKPVLFTEYGYGSVDFAGKEPWRSDRDMTQVNLDAQTNTTVALFEEFWNEEWFAGGFVWKWFIHHDRSGGAENSQFTPQNKPVEDVLRRYYAHE